MKTSPLNTLKARLVSLLIAAFGSLPIGVNQWLGSLLGQCLAHLPLTIRQITTANIDACFPHLAAEDKKQLVRDSLIETCKTYFEVPTMWRQPRNKLVSMVQSVTGQKTFDDAISQGKGVILLGLHLGSFEMVGIFMGNQHNIVGLYRPPKKHFLDKLVRNARDRFGSRNVPTNASGVRALYKALVKEHRVIGIFPDQDPGEKGGQFAPFFGMSTWTMSLVAKLARKSGAPVIFGFAKRLPNAKGFEIILQPASDDIYSEDELTSITAMNKGIEQCVLQCPEQYQWPYKRFKRQPKGAKALYP